MYKVLFSLGSMPVHSYYVLWTGALMLGVWWTRKRMVSLYGCSDNVAASIVFWALIGVYVGARTGSVFDNWAYFSAHPLRIISPFEGGLSALPAFFMGGFFGIFRSLSLKYPWWIPAEAASLPAALVIMTGRVGCFLNGCCYGISAPSSLGVHFPFDPPSLERYPVQLYYSLGAFAILLVLWKLEVLVLRKIPPAANVSRGAFLWPFLMMCYGAMRFLLDHLRQDFYTEKVFNSMHLSAFLFLWGFLWVCFALYRFHRAVQKGN